MGNLGIEEAEVRDLRRVPRLDQVEASQLRDVRGAFEKDVILSWTSRLDLRHGLVIGAIEAGVYVYAVLLLEQREDEVVVPTPGLQVEVRLKPTAHVRSSPS